MSVIYFVSSFRCGAFALCLVSGKFIGKGRENFKGFFFSFFLFDNEKVAESDNGYMLF